jgi:Domain of unknown function (DUF1877)
MNGATTPPRLLGVKEVAMAARFLDATPCTQLAQCYNAKALTDAEVYPQVWDEEDALDYLASYYTDLVAFFHAAAVEYEYILVRLA